MSLQEAYTLAHTAQCRLQIAASRPDRNLRFVVGHLMHYESLRLRIVEIEHDISRSKRATSVTFQGTSHVDYHLQHKPSTGQLGRKSPPPSPPSYEDDDTDSDDEDDIYFDDEAEDRLSLERFPSAAARPPQPPPEPILTEPPELESDDGEYSDEDEPLSPEELSQEELERTIKGEGNELLSTEYEAVRKCACHGRTDAPSFDRMWELPSDRANAKEGIMRAVARVSAEPTVPQSVFTKFEQLQQPQEIAA